MKRTIVVIGIMLLATLVPGTGCTRQNALTENPTAPVPSVIATPDNTAGAADTPTATKPVINIAYSPTFIMQAGVGQVLILNIAIHNYGYDSFEASPEYFSVVVGNKPYKYDASLSDLRAVSVPDGGKLLGKLAFPVPAGTPSTRVGFSMDYSGARLYNIQWQRND